eukprot:1159867-Pelagomonas_calceolata.AAC.7
MSRCKHGREKRGEACEHKSSGSAIRRPCPGGDHVTLQAWAKEKEWLACKHRGSDVHAQKQRDVPSDDPAREVTLSHSEAVFDFA